MHRMMLVYAEYEILTVETMKITIFQDVTPHTLVES
jgi:hypothetical protein